MNKIYLVTGGTSGIGLSTVQLLATKANTTIYSISRSIDKINSAKKLVKSLPGKVHFLQCDVSKIIEITDVYNSIVNKVSVLNGLVNNAGVIYTGGIEQLDINDWKNIIDINLTGAFRVVKTFLPILKNNPSSIVNVSSISSMHLGASVGYSVCKAGLDMFTKGMAKELSKYNIRVNSVNPGITRTGFHVSNNLMNKNAYCEFMRNEEKIYPFGLGDPIDIANAIVFLLSDKARWITGSILVVDGGRFEYLKIK